MFRSLQLTLLLSHAGVLLGTSLALAFLSYQSIFSTIKESRREQMTEIVTHAEKSIQAFLENKKQQLERIAGGQEVMKYTLYFRDTVLASYLVRYQENFSSLSYINEEGRELLRISEGEVVQSSRSFVEHSFFQKALSNPNTPFFFRDASISPGGEPSMQVAIAKFHYFEDKFAGLLLGQVPYRKIAESLADIRVGEDGYLIINDGEGNMMTVFHRPDHPSAQNGLVTLCKQNPPDAGLTGKPEPTNGLNRAVIRGTDSLFTELSMPDLQWTIVAVLPYKEFAAKPIAIRNQFIFLFILFFLLAGMISYLLARTITRPLTDLTDAANAIAQGKLAEISDITSRDEIGRLVQSFNTMTRNLHQTTISRDYFNTILSSMQESLIVLAVDHTIETVNRATCIMLGYEENELKGQLFNVITKHDAALLNNIGKHFGADDAAHDSELVYLTKDGREIPVHFSASPMKDDQGEIYGIVCLAINISRRKKMERALRQSEAKLREIAITDELTGLLNRRGFLTMARRQLQLARRQQENTFLLYADVDGLKWVNDTLGHVIGDILLQETADVLRRTFRDSDICARLGGDEFAVLLADTNDDEEKITSRLKTNIEERNRRQEKPFDLSISVGVIRLNPGEIISIEELMSRADAVMYESKQRKKIDTT